MTPTDQRRADFLAEVFARYHRPEFIGTDPLVTLGRCGDAAEREVLGLIAACLAYGNVKAILRGIEGVLKLTGPSPRDYLRASTVREIERHFAGFRYRVTSGEEMAGLLIGAKKLIESHGSLNACFASHDQSDDATVVPALGKFVGEMCHASGRTLYHLLPHPERGSACKRMMLYLRWMVRRDAIDPGGWTGVSTGKLIIPLDTHMHRMALRLRLTRRKQPNLRTAMEITRSLRKFAPDDPLMYDFSLTRPGIMGLSLP